MKLTFSCKEDVFTKLKELYNKHPEMSMAQLINNSINLYYLLQEFTETTRSGELDLPRQREVSDEEMIKVYEENQELMKILGQAPSIPYVQSICPRCKHTPCECANNTITTTGTGTGFFMWGENGLIPIKDPTKGE
jgi:hypothetical protein